MKMTATGLVGLLDDNDLLTQIIGGLSNGVVRRSVRSAEEFEEAYLELMATRIIGANSRNEFSAKFTGAFDSIRSQSKSLFKLLIGFADNEPDPVCQKDWFLLLCYLKPESPQFVSRVLSLREYIGKSPNPVSDDFIGYLISTFRYGGANVAELSPMEHFRNTLDLNLAGGQMQCRIASGNPQAGARVLCGCSVADSILFDQLKHDFDTYVTLPGLSISHLTTTFLIELYESIILKLTSTSAKQVKITLCVGFVDRLKIIGAYHVWEKTHLESIVERMLADALASIGQANNLGRGFFEYELFPGCFPVRNVDKTMANGVVPFHKENAELSCIVEKSLAAIGFHKSVNLPQRAMLKEDALIHDREIHPKLGADLSRITRPMTFCFG